MHSTEIINSHQNKIHVTIFQWNILWNTWKLFKLCVLYHWMWAIQIHIFGYLIILIFNHDIQIKFFEWKTSWVVDSVVYLFIYLDNSCKIHFIWSAFYNWKSHLLKTIGFHKWNFHVFNSSKLNYGNCQFEVSLCVIYEVKLYDFHLLF
jgi:hypothetical protein